MEKKRLSKKYSVKDEEHGSTPAEPAEFHHWEMTSKKTVEFHWIIKNFTSCFEAAAKSFDSPVFPATDRQQWRLQVCPLGDNEESCDYVSLVVLLVSSKLSQVEAHVKFSILDSKGKKVNEMTFTDTMRRNARVGYSKFIKRSVLLTKEKGLLSKETLTIVCEISNTSNASSTSTDEQSVPPTEVAPTEDLGHLLESKTFCDLFIFVDDVQFPAHKLILAARSPFMANMFQQLMEKENSADTVTLTGIDHDAFDAILRFIYTGRVDRMEDMVEKLLVAANNYQLEHLKFLCEEEMYRKLTVENAVKHLILADLHSASQLRDLTFEFINRNAVDVVRTADWDHLVKSHPHLVAEMYVKSIDMF